MSIATRPPGFFEAFTTATDTAGEPDPMPTAPTAPAPTPAPTARPAEELRISTAAVRVAFTWFGTRRALNDAQREEIAGHFGAEGDSISAGKKLLDTKHPAYRDVTRIKTAIQSDWKDRSLPFPEPGIRLIRRDRIDDFAARMEGYRDELARAVSTLDQHFDEMKEEARGRLGSLYHPGDYPTTLAGLFAVSWDFPNVEPPSYLMQLHPELYEAERARVATQFDEAVRLAEEAFIAQFADAINHLCERLARGDDGQPRIFRDSAIGNLNDFFDRFRSLNVRSNAQLDALVDQAQAAVRGASPTRLRTSTDFRENVARQLGTVAQTLAGMTEARPRRNIQRPNRGETR